MIPFKYKLLGILAERGISLQEFCNDIGLDRPSFFYKKKLRNHHSRYLYMGMAYYLGMDVHELVDGTEAVDDFWGR